MKILLATCIALASAAASATTVSAAASRDDFQGRWSRDCGNARTCHLDIDNEGPAGSVSITFSVEGSGESCTWAVDAGYQQDWGGPVAYDKAGNYFFYLTIHDDGRLYSSGTMVPICGPQPLDQYFVSSSSAQASRQVETQAAIEPLSQPTNQAETRTEAIQVVANDDARAMVENRNVFDHNDSAMLVDPGEGTIMYRDPKRSIAGTVRPGTLLFQAVAPWDPYDDSAIVRGTAYVFKKGCAPAPYEVSGRQEGWHTLVLKGAAPVREKKGCRVIGYKMNGNSTLKFVSWGD